MAPVGIFWDYENIAVPSDVSVSRVVQDLTNLAKSKGSLSSVKCYMDTAYGRQGGKLQDTRGQLQSHAVSVIDTPHQGRKEVADVMIMTDFLVFALENPGAVVVLVTGDKGFRYPVSIARQKNCKVVLVTTEAIKAEGDRGIYADETISYRSELLRLPPRAKSNNPTRPVFQPYASSSNFIAPRPVIPHPRPIASNSRLLDRRPTSPPNYEQAAWPPPLFTADIVPPRMPPSRSPSPVKVKPRNRRGDGGKGKTKARSPQPRSLGVLTLSDDAAGGSDSDFEIQSPVGAAQSVSPPPRFEFERNFPSIDSVVAASSSLQLQFPPKRNILPPPSRATYSSVLSSPPRLSFSPPSQSRSVEPAFKKRVQVSPSHSIVFEEEEEVSRQVAPPKPSLASKSPSKVSQGKKRKISDAEDSEEEVQTVTKNQRKKRARKQLVVTAGKSGESQRVRTGRSESIIVLSDDDDDED